MLIVLACSAAASAGTGCSAWRPGRLAVSLLEVVRTYTGVELAFLDLLPLASLDFGWVLPAAVCGAVGALIPGGRTAAS